jgi:CheY-like chemotaxis protein
VDDAKQPLILIVDDDWMNREMMQSLLENAGYTIVSAFNGDQALKLARAHHPDLILLDVRMNDMSGYDVCARLKGDVQTCTIPILIITALESDDDRARAKAAGADDFITKTTDWTSILSRIARYL